MLSSAASLFISFSALVSQNSEPILGFELIAHRGVHQTFHRENLTMETCTATRIDKTDHSYLENTLPSIRKAFDLGATMVEIDVHPTTESGGEPENLVVFHDWGLNCRTDATCEDCRCNDEGQCITHEQPLSYIQSLDIGYGYTADEGESYPFRGMYVGAAPKLEDVLDLLFTYRDKKILVNVKGNPERSVIAFLRTVAPYPQSLRDRLLYPRGGAAAHRDQELDQLGVPEAIYQGGEIAKTCFKQYIMKGMFGYFPPACRDTQLFIPIRQTLGIVHKQLEGIKLIDLLWGWPEDFLERAHQHGTKIYPSQVDSIEELRILAVHPFDGIMTNKIEWIASACRSWECISPQN